MNTITGTIELPQTKICYGCNFYIDPKCFGKQSSAKDGLQTRCKDCKKLSDAKYHFLNRDKVLETSKAYRKANKEKIAKHQKKYVESNLDKIKIVKHNNYKRNRVKLLKKNKEYLASHPEVRKRATKKYYDKNKLYYQKKNRVVDPVLCTLSFRWDTPLCCGEHSGDHHMDDHVFSDSLYDHWSLSGN
jgi:hypothetical protein